MNAGTIMCPKSGTSGVVDLGRYCNDTVVPLKQTYTNQYGKIDVDPQGSSFHDLRLVYGRICQNSMEYRSQNCKPAVMALKTASANDDVITMSPEDRHLISFLDKLEQEIDLSILKSNQPDTNCSALEPNALFPSKYNETFAAQTFQMMPNDNTTLSRFSENCCPSVYSQMPPPRTGYGEGDILTLQHCTSKAESLKEHERIITKVDSMRLEAVENNEKQKVLTSSNGEQTVEPQCCALGTSVTISLAHRNATANLTAESNAFLHHKDVPASPRFEDDSTSSSSFLDTSAPKPEVVKKDSQVKASIQARKNYGPIRALNAYNFFFIDERNRILSGRSHGEYNKTKKDRLLMQHLTRDRSRRRHHRKSHGKIDFISLARTIGHRWRKLPEEQKMFYRDVAASDLERYYQELSSPCISWTHSQIHCAD